MVLGEDDLESRGRASIDESIGSSGKDKTWRSGKCGAATEPKSTDVMAVKLRRSSNSKVAGIDQADGGDGHDNRCCLLWWMTSPILFFPWLESDF
ncbi:unnamed protein product [Linum trigynum]|uniref:Uncharacterized protein n=1 Tax=Linum trigynum TaxID=586398 RepID=A0AAV2FBX9_9ROSI